MLESFLGTVLVVAEIAVGIVLVTRETRASRAEAAKSNALELIGLFAPGIAAAAEDPRALLVWQPLAAAARKVAPEQFQALDAAAGSTFPFSNQQIEAAHSKWTADWLAWEQAHTGEFKLKSAQAEAELAASGGSRMAKVQWEAVEREKLELYQRHYADYVRVAKALQALIH
jgi:hypothetical protein